VKAYSDSRYSERGLGLIEVLLALTVGLVVLSGLVAFLLSTSKNMNLGQEQARNTSTAQQVLLRLSNDIKGAATQAPPLFALTPNWGVLPALPYTAVELTPYPDTAGSVVSPAVPAARRFTSQAGATALALKWYPNSTTESNSLVFYRVPPPGPGQTARVERVTWRLDTAQAQNFKLIREVQTPIVSGSLSFQSNPTPQRTVLAERVQLLQFTYPDFERAIQAGGTTLDTSLTAIQTAQGYPALARYLNTHFRQTIGIRLVLGGAARSATQTRKGIELTTEVRLR
jgi:Tfp pilus assembly protein PilW